MKPKTPDGTPLVIDVYLLSGGNKLICSSSLGLWWRHPARWITLAVARQRPQ